MVSPWQFDQITYSIEALPSPLIPNIDSYVYLFMLFIEVVSSPELTDLMNDVAAVIPAKWRSVGVQLKLSDGTLDGIQNQNARTPDCCKHSFEQVFTEWRKQKTSPHTWQTIINALRAPAVSELELASRISTKY